MEYSYAHWQADQFLYKYFNIEKLQFLRKINILEAKNKPF